MASGVAARQWGVIASWQLSDCGVSPSAVKRWRRQGWLHGVHPGVYALGHASLPLEGRLTAALLHAGPGAALSHHAAAWVWRLLPDEPAVVDVSAPGAAGPADGVRVHHPRRLELAHHRRLPVTPVPRTLLDLAATAASVETVRFALANAEFHRVLDLAAVALQLGRGRSGSATLRRALERHEPRLAYTRSGLERSLIPLCERSGIPLPRVNVRVEGFLVDAVWPEQRVVVELDGTGNHASPAQMRRDRRRDLRLRAAGYVVVRYSWDQVNHEPELVAADLMRVLGLADAA